MTHDVALADGVIWATRGRSWGFRILLDAGRADPLPDFEDAFKHVPDGEGIFCAHQWVAFRAFDPLGRKDASGRPIPHEFVLQDNWARSVDSVESGLRRVWPLISDLYDQVWGAEQTPTRAAIRQLLQAQ